MSRQVINLNRSHRFKYLEEDHPELRLWYVFGISPDRKTVDIADSGGDVMTGVPHDIADKIIRARVEFICLMEKIIAENSARHT